MQWAVLLVFTVLDPHGISYLGLDASLRIRDLVPFDVDGFLEMLVGVSFLLDSLVFSASHQILP